MIETVFSFSCCVLLCVTVLQYILISSVQTIQVYYYFHLLEELFPMACSSTSERSGRREASCTATVLRAFYVVLRILFALLWYWASFFLREKRKFLVYFIFVEHIAYLSEGKGRWEINYKKYLSGSTSCDFHKIAFFFF